MATPKTNRRKEFELDDLPTPESNLQRDCEAQTIPASSLPRISHSVTLFVNGSGSSSICKATPAHAQPERVSTSVVQGTPCRVPTQSRISDRFDTKKFDGFGRIPPSSPIQSRHQSMQQMLNLPRPLTEEIENFCTPSRASRIHATPIKQSTSLNVENEDPFQTVLLTPAAAALKKGAVEGLQKVESGADDSIYKSLGWDDYDDF